MKIQNFEYVEQATASGMKTMHNHIILGFALALTTSSSSSSLLLLSVFLDLSFVVIKELLETERAFSLKKWFVLFNISVGFSFSRFEKMISKPRREFEKDYQYFFFAELNGHWNISRLLKSETYFFTHQFTQFLSVRFIMLKRIAHLLI